MKVLMVLSMLVLVGCAATPTADNPIVEEKKTPVAKVTTQFDEVELLLTAVELAVGLGNYATANTYFSQLQAVINDHELTVTQTARLNTMINLLVDEAVITVVAEYDEAQLVIDEPIFTGSAAVAKVMNWIGEVPGYTLVYHAIPSFVGSTGIGFYVFLVAEADVQQQNIDARERFFVTSAGEILVLE